MLLPPVPSSTRRATRGARVRPRAGARGARARRVERGRGVVDVFAGRAPRCEHARLPRSAVCGRNGHDGRARGHGRNAGPGAAGKVGIQWPSDIVCGAPAFETSLARVAVNGGAGAAGMFAAVTVDIERSVLGELGVDMGDEVLVEALAAAVLARVDAWAVAANTPQALPARWPRCWASISIWCRCWVVRSRRCRPTACRSRSACLRAWTSGVARPLRLTPASKSFRPRPYEFAGCNERRQRSKITMTTRPSSACAGEGFAYLGNGLPASYSSKLKNFRF